ncbi:type IVB secretion system protein IcmH/DotU [Aliiroseovarius sp.]|uniref:type IVB secretion system protein IcmH/DotU n=1 Tax=Aliiroseovarius sp. TaxID=1872442 RepID=UPI003BAB101C
MHGDDDDGEKTVFGQKLPTPASRPPQAGQGGAPAGGQAGGFGQPPAPPQQPPQAPQPDPASAWHQQTQLPQSPPAAGGAGDEDKTVFGAQLPPLQPGGQAGGQAGGQPAPYPAHPQPPQQPQQPQYGQQPPMQPGPGRAAPTGQAPYPGGFGQPAPPAQPHASQDDTWLGGALTPHPAQPPAAAPYPPQQQPQQPAYGQQPQYQPQYQPQNVPTGADMFPEVPRDPQPAEPQLRPRIALEDALKGTGLGAGGSTNPLIAAAANLLILLGRLRTGLVEMQSGPLIDHVTREIDLYERNALQAGVSQQDASDAKYALAATADDIVQNLPGADRSTWMQYSMVARFFGERDSGVGFFRKMDQAMSAPGQRFQVLEVMLTCLSLGFEGQYRTARNGAVELARVRAAIYETLRRVAPRPDDDVSVHWTPMAVGNKRRHGGTPIWVVAAVAGLMVVALFATLSTLIARQGTQVQSQILALHDGLPGITIERTAPVTPEAAYVAPAPAQLDRIRAKLADQIEDGLVVVDQSNQFIFVRVGEALQFRSARAELQSDFEPLALAIAQALNDEPGPIRVVGHTDSQGLSGRGRYKNNEELSLARAQTVAGIIGPHLSDAARLSTEGLGPVEPIADNGTAEGRAMNRRVEIMIGREELAQ